MFQLSIQDVLSKRLESQRVNHSQPFLKQGQIVQGKIVKLFPNNKAQIQIGSQKMIAQLEASLSIGENYHFQVKANGDVVHLKVIGEQLKGNVAGNMQMLLEGLGIKATKATISLMQALMREKVPFDREQLMKALQLVGSASNKMQAQSVMKEMLVHKLPITDSVFQALYTKSTSGFSEQLTNLLQQLKQDTKQAPVKQGLIDRLSSLTEHTNSTKGTLIKHILTELDSTKTNFLAAAKAAGFVNENVTDFSWKTEWQNFSKINFGSTMAKDTVISNQKLSSLALPFNINESDMLSTFKQFVANKESIMGHAQTLLREFSPALNKANIHQTALSSEEFSHLKLQVEQKLIPTLSSNQQQRLRTLLQNNPVALEQLHTLFKTYANEQTTAQIDKLVKNVNSGNNFVLSKPHEQFLTQLKQVLQSTGFVHEYQIANNLPEQHSATIKSMVLQLLQQNDGVVSDRAQQLLQFINGMQIQSVNETTNFLQASLLVPGEKLALNKDLQLEFEGKKTEDGKIDPAYCRILFYLDLSNLEETVIDMHVQKRAVAVTIFNDSTSILNHASTLKPMLKEGLKGLDYHLSTISVKPLKQMDVDREKASNRTENNSYKGVDYRI